jgi:hypothetical protein
MCNDRYTEKQGGCRNKEGIGVFAKGWKAVRNTNSLCFYTLCKTIYCDYDQFVLNKTCILLQSYSLYSLGPCLFRPLPTLLAYAPSKGGVGYAV